MDASNAVKANMENSTLHEIKYESDEMLFDLDRRDLYVDGVWLLGG
jgi:hypothetical protein